MIAIGLTGGIGSGKTLVSNLLKELGAGVIDADLVGHKAYEPHTDGWRAVVEAFGDRILGPASEVDRKKLGTVVFSDPEALKLLNAIMHPRIYKMLEGLLAELRDAGTQVALIEAAVLIEAGWQALMDEVWVVASDEKTVIERLLERNNLTEDESQRRIRSQLSNEERAKHATALIENNGSLDDLRQRVHGLWDSRIQGRIR
jgi:dephospho-CoA kinase